MNRWAYYVFGCLMFCFYSSCDTSVPSDRLPILGHYDVLTADFDGYEKGDTIFHSVPYFSYLTQDSVLLTSDDIDGKIWIAKFFFAKCPTICPPMTSSMKQVKNDLSDLDDMLVYLSFSIDPKNDTPTHLCEYMRQHQITSENWYFLTNDDEEATHLLGTEGFKIHAMSDDNAPGGYAHSPNFILVDRKKRIRGIYDGLDRDQVEQLKLDVKKLVRDEYNIAR